MIAKDITRNFCNDENQNFFAIKDVNRSTESLRCK